MNVHAVTSGRYHAGFEALSAAADFLGNGAIETNRYESEIVDLVRRESVFFSRVDAKPATGHPHRYFEQIAIASGAFTDPRNIAPTPSGPDRVERAAFIKAVTAQTNLSLFDVDVTRMQGQFAGLEAKDIEDIVSAIITTEAPAIWSGSDTSLSAPTTTQYMGLLKQITTQAVIAPGASIIDGVKAQVASMAARTDFKVKPTAIYLNPILADLIDREAKASKIDLGTVVVAGVSVKAISTVVGDLPLISEPWLAPGAAATALYGFSAPPTGIRSHWAVIVTETLIEMPCVHGGDGNTKPRIFQLGLLANLTGQYVGVHFNTVIAKGYSYAHAIVQVQRP
jgi:hypothetical protein